MNASMSITTDMLLIIDQLNQSSLLNYSIIGRGFLNGALYLRNQSINQAGQMFTSNDLSAETLLYVPNVSYVGPVRMLYI